MEGRVDQLALAGVLWAVEQKHRVASHDRLEDAVGLASMGVLAAVGKQGPNDRWLGDADDATAEGQLDGEVVAVAAAEPAVELCEVGLPDHGQDQRRPSRAGWERGAPGAIDAFSGQCPQA